ncbi:MAG: NAD(P)/FAD-dependent oxidoreductase [Cyanobacteria bacterium J06638_22]
MEKFDVVVVGAGPAGGHCARLLSQIGHRVLLIERYKDFSRNNFSSAGTPLETLTKFQLPDSVIGSYWQELGIVTSRQQGLWRSETPQGVVMDFARLRQFLADEVMETGGVVWLGCRYLTHQSLEDGSLAVDIKNNLSDTTTTINAQILVDATGPARAIMRRPGRPQAEFISGTGIEYLIRVDRTTYEAHARRLTFLLGEKWMPRGYAWIFPMADQQLKVGAGALNGADSTVARSLKTYTEKVLHEYLQPQTYELLDTHGETLRYSSQLRDIYTEGPCIIAIGDAVSTVNFLGGEGIRHGMTSAAIATRYIDERLQGKRSDLRGYQREMHRLFRRTWNISERLGRKKYVEDADEMVDRIVTYLRPMQLEELVDLLFFYRFPGLFYRQLKRFWRRLLRPFYGFK